MGQSKTSYFQCICAPWSTELTNPREHIETLRLGNWQVTFVNITLQPSIRVKLINYQKEQNRQQVSNLQWPGGRSGASTFLSSRATSLARNSGYLYVNKSMSKPTENFYMNLSHILENMPRNRISTNWENAVENGRFAANFIHLESKEGYMKSIGGTLRKQEKSKQERQRRETSKIG